MHLVARMDEALALLRRLREWEDHVNQVLNSPTMFHPLDAVHKTLVMVVDDTVGGVQVEWVDGSMPDQIVCSVASVTSTTVTLQSYTDYFTFRNPASECRDTASVYFLLRDMMLPFRDIPLVKSCATELGLASLCNFEDADDYELLARLPAACVDRQKIVLMHMREQLVRLLPPALHGDVAEHVVHRWIAN